jgi:hypothetical protein
MRTHVNKLFKCENIFLAMPFECFRDKTYGVIRCEAKHLNGALENIYSRKGMLR